MYIPSSEANLSEFPAHANLGFSQGQNFQAADSPPTSTAHHVCSKRAVLWQEEDWYDNIPHDPSNGEVNRRT